MKVTTESEIEFCDQCPHAKVEKVWTPDSWDVVRKVYCNKLERQVYSYLSWYEKAKIPSECPFNAKDQE